MSKKKDILKLRNLGKSYNEIKKELGCSKSLISYYCSSKEKSRLRGKKFRKLNPLFKRVFRFQNEIYTNNSIISNKHYSKHKKLRDKIQTFTGMTKLPFTVKDVINKFGENPVCPLSGEVIDLKDSYNCAFDHKIPKSRGGENTLDNLQILTRKANQAKSDMTNEEFIEFCKQVLIYQGYSIMKQ